MLRRLGFLLLVCSAFARAATNPSAQAVPFTQKELAQGYREHRILARPLESRTTAAAAAEAAEGLHVRQTFHRLRNLRVLELAGTETADQAIARLRATGRYEFVEPDYLRHITAEPNDPKFTDGSLWGLKNTGASNGIVGADIDAPAAWDIIHDAPNVIVAVVDTGVNLAHQDLAGNLWTNPSPTFGDVHGANFVEDTPTGDPTDDNGHGTHVAGTIGAAGNNGSATTGVAWKVQIMAIKSFPASGTASVSDIAEGVDYAIAHGAQIVNASYGEDGSLGYSQTELAALTAAHDAGVIVVAAAGNSAADMDVTRHYPASHALDNIVTVGATARRDEIAPFSNFGSAVDLFAPGSEILSLNYANNTGTISLSGTSMAAPHVTGALALLKARFPQDNYRQLINRLLRGVDRQPGLLNKAQTGGRLNLYRALTTTTNRPYNDDFADRPRLNGSNLAIRSGNAGATPESAEVAPPGQTARASLWWEWTAPTSGTVSVDTAGSGYDTTLAIYTASNAPALTTPTALTLVASNDDDAQVLTSRVTFAAQAGVIYEIAVDSKTTATGLTLLNLGTTPANDAFASPGLLTGQSTQVTATNAHCSREVGEPQIFGLPGGTSLWYRWTAPRSGRFQIAAVSGDFDPLLGVFTGTSLNALTLVAQSDNSGATNADTGALCTIDVVAGTSYALVVDAKFAGTVGQFTLSIVDSLWQAATTQTVTGSAAVGADGTIYFGSNDGAAYAYAPDGTLKWRYATSGLIDTCSPAIADDGTIYIGSFDGKLYALTAAGTLKWTHDFGTAFTTANSPAVAADGTIYLKPSDGYLYAINPADGSMKWRRDVHGIETYASPSIAPDGTIYQGSEDKNLYAFNPDGTSKWTFAADNDIYAAPAIDAAGNLYFTVLNTGKLFCVSPAGALKWTYSGATLGSSSSPALSADGATVYFAGYDGKLHAVDATNGSARWVFTLGDETRASSPAVDANGVIYIGCYDHKLYAINADGTLKRTWDTGDIIRSCPGIFGNTLYVGSNDHKLYAFDIGAGLASGPWPEYRQNRRRLARAVSAAVPPTIILQPASQSASIGASLTLTAGAVANPAPTFQWQLNGTALAGATEATLTLSDLQPAKAGLYTVAIASGTTVTTTPAIVGLNAATKVIGSGTELDHDIHHPNGNVFDQVLLTGPAESITADFAQNQITRTSFIDLDGDIVQVEFSGPGTLSLVLADASSPAPPQNYHQDDISYVKGHAGIVITGADERTNVSVFTVGRATAFDPTNAYDILKAPSSTNDPAKNGSPLFVGHESTAYDGIADIAFIAISSANGKFGGIRTANANYFAAHGLTGVYAPGVAVTGPIYLGNVTAFDSATPVIVLGSVAGETRITGGDLFQENGAAVQISGLTQLKFTDGSDSAGRPLPAKANRAILQQNGQDVTIQVVSNPTP